MLKNMNNYIKSFLKTRMTKTIIIVLSLVLSLYLTGCNEQPTELGYKIDSVSFTAISSADNDLIAGTSAQRFYLSPFNAGIVQVGKFAEYSSYPILRYGNIDSLEGVELISTTLHLIKSGYALGDTNDIQSFEIFEVQQPIVPSSTYETIFKANGVDAVYKEVKMGQFEAPFNQLKDTTQIELDNQLIQNWIDFSVLENSGQLDTNDIRRQYSYSIGLKPTENSKVINGFLSERLGNSGTKAPSPFIKLVYKKPSSSINDTLIIRANIAAYYADGPIPDINSLTVQSGVSLRSKIDFDLSELPQFAAVVKAVLKVYVDDSRSVTGSLGRDSVILAQKDLTFDDDFFPDNNNIYLGIRNTGNNYFRFTSITSAVEDWVQDGTDKTGSLLLNYAPNSNPGDTYFRLDKFYIYGADADSSLRPELTIFYAKRPEF